MKLPEIFKQDIQSNNIQLIPLLIIERDANWSDWSYNSESIFLSTHDLNIVKSESGLPYTETSFDNGMYFSPLLLDSPIITEKIDIENRKYTISKCTFKISNNPYDGQRFSDMLNIDSLIGKKVNFAYKSINSSLPVGSTYFDATGDNTWADLYDVDWSGSYISPTFYYGEIRDIKHNNETVTITAEDLGSVRFHKDLPMNHLPNNDSIQNIYRDAPIPMVYGYNPISPLVMGKNKMLYPDYRPISGWFTNNINNDRRYGYPFGESDYSPLFISIDDNLCNIINNIDFPLTETQKITDWGGYGTNVEQVNYDTIDNIYGVSVAKLTKNPLLSRSMLQVLSVYKPSKISLEERHNDVTWDPDNISGTSLGDSDVGWLEDFLLEEEFEEMTDGDYSPNDTLASSDTPEYIRTEAMINSTQDGQMSRNYYKHSLFRFVIDVEPPIEFINRGGIGGGNQQYYHWISFGHWVMPDQASLNHNENHNIYTYARDNSADDSSYNISRRWYVTYDEEGESEGHESLGYLKASPYQASNPLLDHWGREIQLGDIIRFSNYHDDATFSDINPEQINWSNHGGGKSPLEFYDLGYINETGNANYDKSYSNPYAKFTNGSEYGWYDIQLGAYGWLGSLSFSIDGVDQTTQYTIPPDLCPNFDYTGNIKGWLPEVNCMSVCDIKTNFEGFYGSVVGRVDLNNNAIYHPADIIADIFVNELGYSEDKIDQTTLDNCKSTFGHDGWKFSFTQKDTINSKDLIEDIAKSTFIFPRISFDGLLKFPSFKRTYSVDDWNNSILIQRQDVISYSYNLTKREQLASGVKVKYDYDHQNNNYFGDENTKANPGSNNVYNIITGAMTDEQAEFYGIDDKDEFIKEFESKYMRSSNNISASSYGGNKYQKTIKSFATEFYVHFYKNRHLIIKCKLPIKYLNIEIGDYVIFDNLIDDVKAYGIDYSRIVDVNGQSRFPMFMCTSIKKSIDYVELECLQLAHLYNYPPEDNSFWYDITPENINEIHGNTEDLGISGDLEDWTLPELPQLAFLHPQTASEYIYGSFDLAAGQSEFPYGTYNITSDLYSEFLIIMDTSFTVYNEEYQFNDPNTGIHTLFNYDRFMLATETSTGGWQLQQGNSWNFLIPPDWFNSNGEVIVTLENRDYTALEINHSRTTGSSILHYNFTYKLKNQTLITGFPMTLGWELVVNESDGNHEGGIIFAAPYYDFLHPGGVFTISNLTEIVLVYNPPHPISDPIVSQIVDEGGDDEDLEDGGNGDLDVGGNGDVNQDGVVNILDIAIMVNFIANANQNEMTDAEYQAADVTGDGTVNILDILALVNLMLDNS